MRQIVAVIIGAAAFSVTFLVMGLSIAVSSIIGIIGYTAGILLVSTSAKPAIETVPGQEVDHEALKKILAEADEKISAIAVFSGKNTQPEARKHLERICALAKGIVGDIRKDPGDARRARQFLNYYLDAVARIMGTYAKLIERGIKSEEARAALNKVENLFVVVETAFEKQRAKLAQDDVLDLDTEIDLLKKTLAMEGMTDEK